MPKSPRQTNTDRPTLTRAQVAKRLGRDVSWVRRHEGKELHPVLVDGANRFDPSEVDALGTRLEAERMEAEQSEETMAWIQRVFAAHVKDPSRVSVEGIMERTDLDARAVRSLHAKWAAECRKAGATVPPLLTRGQIEAEGQREIDAINREYDERMARMEREEVEQRKLAEARRKRWEQELAENERANQERRARRKAESETRIANLRPALPDSNVLDVLAKFAGSRAVDEVTKALLELVRRR